MTSLWEKIFSLDDERSIWVREEDLGREKPVHYRNKRYLVRIPTVIKGRITLRLRGFGKVRFGKAGDLYLHVWLNKGVNVRGELWISESSAGSGADKKLRVGDRTITLIVPPGSHHDLTIRLKGYGEGPKLTPLAPPLEQPHMGDLLVKLLLYPDRIEPRYGSFDALSTEDMALEGWVYRKFDFILEKLGSDGLSHAPLATEVVTDAYNELGWHGVFDLLARHLNLGHLPIGKSASSTLSRPGFCLRTVDYLDNRFAVCSYKIQIQERFLQDPFCVTAILAHELCHVLYAEKLEKPPLTTGTIMGSDKASMEEERTVDLLAFMFHLGEFQLRVARSKHLTLGYFDQDVFERIQVIVSRKLKARDGSIQ